MLTNRNIRRWADRTSTNNMVSFQLAIPTGSTDRVFVRYALASGNADGQRLPASASSG